MCHVQKGSRGTVRNSLGADSGAIRRRAPSSGWKRNQVSKEPNRSTARCVTSLAGQSSTHTCLSVTAKSWMSPAQGSVKPPSWRTGPLSGSAISSKRGSRPYCTWKLKVVRRLATRCGCALMPWVSTPPKFCSPSVWRSAESSVGQRELHLRE
jgi:hypothetical protein